MSAATKRALQRQCDAFNASAPVGTRVAVRNDRGGVVQTVTRSRAEVLGGHSAVIWLEGISGCYSLDRVTLYDGPPAEDTADDRARQALAKAYIDAGKPGIGEYIGLGNLFVPDQPIWIAAMLAFATAEAARGAGEREGWTLGRCAALCDELATKCRAELKDPSNDVATISALHGCLGACETLAASIRAAATPEGDAA